METEKDVSMGQPGLMRKLAITGQLNRMVIYIVSAALAIVFLLMALFAHPAIGILKPFTFQNITIGSYVDFIVFAVLTSTGVYGIYEFFRLRRVRKIDDRFPDFVRDIAESRRAGMTFTNAIMNAAKGNYGVLTQEIQKVARQISWGSSVEKALNSFASRVNTKLIRRTISLIIEASRSGGNVADVLEAASKDARELRFIESERRAGMLSYVAVVYVGIGVFLLIIIILSSTLIPQMLGQESMGMREATSSTLTGSPDLRTIDVVQAFFYASLIQSGGMGLVAGIFEEGVMKAGIKHIFIMILVCWIVFKFIVTGV